MANENNPVGKADKNQTVEREREEGDGNDSTCSLSPQCNGNVLSSNGHAGDKDPPKEERPTTGEKIKQAVIGESKKEKTGKGLNSEDNDLSVVPHVQEKWNDFSKKKIARVELSTSSCSLSFKELRKQLKHLYGHDLIRRILQTSSGARNAHGLQFSQLSTSGKSLNKVTVRSIPANLSQVFFDQVKKKTVESICTAQPGSTKQIENCSCPDRPNNKQGDPQGDPQVTSLQVPERSLPVKEEKRGQLQLDSKGKKVEPDHLHTLDRQSPQTGSIIDKEKCSAQQRGLLKVGCNQEAVSQMMRSSKVSHSEKSSQPPQNDNSDHSDSVVSLQSSSSDDGKPNHQELSSEDAGIPVIQTESVRDVTESRETHDLQIGGDMLNHDIDSLHQKIQKQPTQDTLEEIIRMLKTQNPKDSPLLAHDSTEQRLGSQMSWPQDSSLEGNPYRATQPYPSSLAWNTSVPPLSLTVGQTGGQKLREKHSRQLKDVAAHYESEIDKLRDQLDEVRNNLTALQETLPVKQLESENHKLETRCHVLEQVCEQLKNKLVRLEQAHQELDSVCDQLKQVNQNLEVRCLYLEQVNQTNESERSHLQQNIRDLEAKVLELVESSERAIATCRHLEDTNHKFEAKNQALEESQAVLETHYKNCIGENHKLDAQVFQLQKTLEESNKKCKELEGSVVVLHRKKESLAVELQASNKAGMTTQQRFEEMKSMCSSKDELISRLENELRDLSSFVEKTVKEKAQSEQDSKRDRELLQRMLIEYDVLAKNHLEARSSSKAVQEKLDVSQDEINSLRGTISKLISRNNSLEESLRDVSNQENKSSDYFKPFSGRRTWDHSTPIKKADSPAQSLRPPYAVTEPEKRSPATEAANSRPYCGSPGQTGTLPSAAVAKTSTLSGKKQEPTPVRPKAASPAGQAKRNLMKGYSDTAKEGSEVKPAPPKTPGGMVVKKADLVTRFDVVFEDSSSGQEVLRTHTGRTRRNYGESAQTELSFVEGEGSGHKNTAEAALSAVKEGRVLGVGDAENKNTSRGSKSKQQAMYNVPEKDLGGEHAQSTAKEKTSDGDENDVYLMERRFSMLSEERKRLESTLSRIPSQKMTKRTKEDKAYLEDRLEDVVKEIGSVRMQLKRHHAL